MTLNGPRPRIPAQLEAGRIVALIRRADAAAAVETAQALIDGGIVALEVTCDSPGALDMIRAICQSLGERVLVGAGTVLDATTAQAALDAGAQFLVSPHIDAPLVGEFAARGVAWIPGALSPTEVRAGAAVVKLFPAGPLGPGYIKDVLGPVREIPLLPTGGVTLDNATDFLAAGAWGLGMGSALVDSRLVAARRFDELRDRARRLTQLVDRAHGT
jgi:2-dehydro-3-deoxyphosphogluconate aldolase / (4S)-4-hydroxy-2-oxoglutarate aldolase